MAANNILPLYPVQSGSIVGEKQRFLLEIRTNFKLKLKSGDDRTLMLGSERFGELGFKDADARYFEDRLGFRLKEDYRMSKEELLSLGRAILDFAAGEEIAVVVVLLEVWTVQQEAEGLEAAMGRAIKEEDLIPIYVWPLVPKGIVQYEESGYRYHKVFFWALPKIRVVDEDHVGIGEVCRVCSRDFVVGAQVSFLPACNHALHSRCVFNWLKLKNYFCPSCHRPIPSDAQRDYASFHDDDDEDEE